MKKFFSFVAAALLSTTMFASREVVPTAADLAGYATGNYTFCYYFETLGDTLCESIDHIALVGSFCEWKTDQAVNFEALEGFAGWYVVSVTDASETAYAKPVVQQSATSWSWDYQPGKPETLTVLVGEGNTNFNVENSEETSMGFTAPGTYVIAVTAFKLGKTPCAAVVPHHYTVKMFVEDCPIVETTYLIGDFDGWKGTEMDIDMEGDRVVYKAEFDDQEGHGFKPYSGSWDEGKELMHYVEADDEWKNFENFLLDATENIVLDFTKAGSALGQTWETVKWGECREEQAINNVFENARIEKVLENGQLIIKVDGVRYTTTGARL